MYSVSPPPARFFFPLFSLLCFRVPHTSFDKHDIYPTSRAASFHPNFVPRWLARGRCNWCTFLRFLPKSYLQQSINLNNGYNDNWLYSISSFLPPNFLQPAKVVKAEPDDDSSDDDVPLAVRIEHDRDVATDRVCCVPGQSKYKWIFFTFFFEMEKLFVSHDVYNERVAIFYMHFDSLFSLAGTTTSLRDSCRGVY